MAYKVLKERFEEISALRAVHDAVIGIEKQTVLKSALILLLYNTIEGTFSILLQTLFDCVDDGKLSLEGNSLLEKEYNKYREKVDKEKKIAFSIWFSGNLDRRKIEEVCRKMGILLIKDGVDGRILGEKLFIVKESRNDLAHGNKSFSECSRDYTIQEIDYICEDVMAFMQSVIIQCEKFIKNNS